jgi:hypothetical protein
MHLQGLQLPVWMCTLAPQDPYIPRPKGQCQSGKRFQEDTSWPQQLLQGQGWQQGNICDSSTGSKREDARENCNTREKTGTVLPTAKRLPASACATPDAVIPASAGTQLSAGATPFTPLVLARTTKEPCATRAHSGSKRIVRSAAPAPGGAASVPATLNILTWNAANLARGTKELALSHLLVSNNVDVAVITETELPAPSAVVFSINGYTTYLPLVLPGAKTRVLTLVKSNLAMQASAKLCLDLMSSSVQSVWIQLSLPKLKRLVIGGVYRQWSSVTTPSLNHLPVQRKCGLAFLFLFYCTS